MMYKAIIIGACMLASSVLAADHTDDPVQTLMENELDFLLEQTQREAFPDEAYVSPFEKPADAGESSLIPELLINNPIFATLPGDGMGFALVELSACSVNQPHVHPRATEFAFVTEGSISMGIVEENGGGPAIVNNVYKNQGMTFPQGLVHWQFNDNCEPAMFLASLANSDPGVLTVSQRFLEIPDGVLRAVLGVDDRSLRHYKRTVSKVPQFPTDPECLKRCGLA